MTMTSAKAERIEIRVSPSTKALLTAAAQARHTTVSEFLLSHAVAAAEQIVVEPRVFYADEAAWDQIQSLLAHDADALPDAEAIAWLTRMGPAV